MSRIEELMRLARQDAERKHNERLSLIAKDTRTLGEKWGDDRWGEPGVKRPKPEPEPPADDMEWWCL